MATLDVYSHECVCNIVENTSKFSSKGSVGHKDVASAISLCFIWLLYKLNFLSLKWCKLYTLHCVVNGV